MQSSWKWEICKSAHIGVVGKRIDKTDLPAAHQIANSDKLAY